MGALANFKDCEVLVGLTQLMMIVFSAGQILSVSTV